MAQWYRQPRNCCFPLMPLSIIIISWIFIVLSHVGLKYLKQQFGVRNKSQSLVVLSASQRPHLPCVEVLKKERRKNNNKHILKPPKHPKISTKNWNGRRPKWGLSSTTTRARPILLDHKYQLVAKILPESGRLALEIASSSTKSSEKGPRNYPGLIALHSF